MELVRFLVVAVGGVVIDIAIAYSLATYAGVPLWIAAAIGFAVAAACNYVIHEVWTFRGGARQLSARRGMQYVGVSVLTLLARLLVVAALSAAFGTDHALAILICGAGVSFGVNFLISKYVVFSKGAGGGMPSS